MNNKIRVGIVGYGNLGRGVEKAIAHHSDLELVAIFSRRPPEQVNAQGKVVSVEEIFAYKDQVDVMILCGGSAQDLPEQGPLYAQAFNTVDSFDLHSHIPQYFAAMDAAARQGGNLSVISIGWDPGLFSLARLLFASVLPDGKSYTFWGKGVSQGHSVAIRQVPGVRQAVQYTVPVPETVEQIRLGATPTLTPREQHHRICFVVPEVGADLDTVENSIKTIPGYFADYDTTVHFITEEQFAAEHTGMPHGGFVIRTGATDPIHKQQMEFRLDLDSNPEFTASILVAYARATYRLHKAGDRGARTIFDVPIGSLSPVPLAELRKELL
ncbi:MAG: diaminopimelate dehydrogenase [Firmicutes bacterium]|nr:diaminopimelate dehydrogenase [Bacillota bacterium]